MSTQSLYSIASHIQDRDVIINIIDDEAELFCCLCIVAMCVRGEGRYMFTREGRVITS